MQAEGVPGSDCTASPNNAAAHLLAAQVSIPSPTGPESKKLRDGSDAPAIGGKFQPNSKLVVSHEGGLADLKSDLEQARLRNNSWNDVAVPTRMSNISTTIHKHGRSNSVRPNDLL